MARYKRRRLFIHPLPYWFVVTAPIYFSSMLVVLYGIVILPMVQSLDNPSAPWQERAQEATRFLDFNARVWPWLLGMPPSQFSKENSGSLRHVLG